MSNSALHFSKILFLLYEIQTLNQKNNWKENDFKYLKEKSLKNQTQNIKIFGHKFKHVEKNFLRLINLK
jgi:hypothetical protein